jgi:hypothetical protein
MTDASVVAVVGRRKWLPGKSPFGLKAKPRREQAAI